MVPQAANPANPDGLPIGLSRTPVTKVLTQDEHAGDYVGFTCAACHNSQLYYQGKRIRIDGGANTWFDFQAYNIGLDDAMQATLKDPAKFDRLAARLGASEPGAKSALRERLEMDATRQHKVRKFLITTPTVFGPGRIDAVAMIVNRVTTILPNIPQNNSSPVAPSKSPFMWNAPQGSWTQWRAAQQNPIERNMTEVMGVLTSVNLTAKSPADGLFESNAQIHNLIDAENRLQRLAPPSWPEEVFGKIDREKAAKGKGLFANLCSSCHNMWPYTWTEPNKYGKRFVLVGLVPQSYIGTDPGQFETARDYVFTEQLSPYMPGPFKDKAVVPFYVMYYAGIMQTLEAALSKAKLSGPELLDATGYRELPTPLPPARVYKAAPRDGVWATAPFMHNNSVPSLYEMLVPAKERTKKFCIGREFDPVKVGIDPTCRAGMFVYDTAVRGNSNAGHSFEEAPRGTASLARS